LTFSSKISEVMDLLKNGYAKLPITTRDNNFLKKLSENPNVAKVQYAHKDTIISNDELLKIFMEIKNLVANSKTIFSRKFFSLDDIYL